MFLSRIKAITNRFLSQGTCKVSKRFLSSINTEEVCRGPYNFIDGSRVSPSEPQSTLDICNPATGDVFGKLSVSLSEDIRNAVASSSTAFKAWSEVGDYILLHAFLKV